MVTSLSIVRGNAAEKMASRNEQMIMKNSVKDPRKTSVDRKEIYQQLG